MCTETKVYVMKNEIHDVVIQCTEKYLLSWLARGFVVTKVMYVGTPASSKKSTLQ